LSTQILRIYIRSYFKILFSALGDNTGTSWYEIAGRFIVKKPSISIVGRVNVGKSTLFNRLCGFRSAIVEDSPGVTRDRKEVEIVIRDRPVFLIDTGGLDVETTDLPLQKAQEQTRLAVKLSDIVFFVVDGRAGLLPGDSEIALLIRQAEKPVVLLVNKLDELSRDYNMHDFHALGFDPVIAISAEHGLGILELEEATIALFEKLGWLSSDDGSIPESPLETKVAVVGKPNVGKSSLINAILGEERHIVTEVPGTTRDAVDSIFRFQDKFYRFIDTAGLRRIGKTKDKLDRISSMMARRSIDACEIALLVIDSSDGFTNQDAHIGGYINDAGRGCIVVANKWDLLDKSDETYRNLLEKFKYQFGFLDWAPFVTVSTLSRHHVFKLFQIIDQVKSRMMQNVPTSSLNKILHDAQIVHTPPRRDQRHQLKFYYGTQISHMPPTFKIFTNTREPIHFSYTRFLVNRLRAEIDYSGCPIRIIYQHKHEK
jgi:GTPase